MKNSQFSTLKGYNKKYYLTHPWEIVSDIISDIKWALQRVFRGWDDRVCWSIDSYLFEMLPEWLRQLKEVKQGIPIWCLEATGATWDNKECKYSNEDLDAAEAYFDDILDQMIDGFESGYKGVQSELDIYDEFDKWQIEKYGSICDWDIFDDDSEHRKRRAEFDMLDKIIAEENMLKEKLDKAFELLCEYHDSLWD